MSASAANPPPLNLLLVILLVCLFACVRVCVRVLCAFSAAGSVLALLFLCITRHLAMKWADGGLNHGCPPRWPILRERNPFPVHPIVPFGASQLRFGLQWEDLEVSSNPSSDGHVLAAGPSRLSHPREEELSREPVVIHTRYVPDPPQEP